MAGNLTDALIFAVLASIIAWLLSRAIARSDMFKDAPDRDPYLDNLLREIWVAARKDRGDGTASSSDPTLNIEAIARHRGSSL